MTCADGCAGGMRSCRPPLGTPRSWAWSIATGSATSPSSPPPHRSGWVSRRCRCGNRWSTRPGVSPEPISHPSHNVCRPRSSGPRPPNCRISSPCWSRASPAPPPRPCGPRSHRGPAPPRPANHGASPSPRASAGIHGAPGRWATSSPSQRSGRPAEPRCNGSRAPATPPTSPGCPRRNSRRVGALGWATSPPSRTPSPPSTC